jgi:hypothetical protein
MVQSNLNYGMIISDEEEIYEEKDRTINWKQGAVETNQPQP